MYRPDFSLGYHLPWRISVHSQQIVFAALLILSPKASYILVFRDIIKQINRIYVAYRFFIYLDPIDRPILQAFVLSQVAAHFFDLK